MSYADYGYYREEYLGTGLGEEDFPRLALRASEYLDYYTQGRAAEQAGAREVKNACCALAEQYQIIDQAETLAWGALRESPEGREIESETVGAHSVRWKGGGESAAQAQTAAEQAGRALAETARRYLAGTGLCYRGGRGHVRAGHGDGI